MKKLLGQIALGLVLCAGGIYLGYLFLASLNTSANFIFILGSLLCLGGGVFFLIKAGKSDLSVISAAPEQHSGSAIPKSKSVLELNQEMANEWNNTMSTRDRLKMLEAAGNAEQ